MPISKFIIFSLLILFSGYKSYAQTCPPNIDFEAGNYSRWEFFTGYCCPLNANVSTLPSPGRLELTNGTALDIYGNFPIVAPNGGNYSLKLGNDAAHRLAQRARYYLKVPTGNNEYVIVFKYAVVLQSPNHTAADQPRFEVSAYDSATGALVPCSRVTYVASPFLPGFVLSPVQIVSGPIYYKSWASASIFLGKYVAGKTVALDFASGACDLGQHFGYAYIDMDCGLFQTYYSIACSPASTVTLDAPPGYAAYQWMDSLLTKTIDTTKTLTVSVPDTTTVFAVILTPYSGFGCKDTLYTRVANLSVKTRDTLICLNGGTGQLQLSAKVKGDATPIIYNWYPSTGLSCTNCPNPIATVSTTKKYYIDVTDANGCVKKDSINIEVAPAAYAKVNAARDTICQYEPVEISDTSTNPIAVVHYWNVDTGTIKSGAGGPLINVSWSTPGLKKVMLRVSNGRCERRDSTTIYVKPSPLAFFEIKHNLCLGEQTKLYPKQNDNSFYYWTIDEFEITDTLYRQSFDIWWDSLDKKSIKLVTIGENGCKTSYDTMVRIHEFPTGKIQLNDPNICLGDLVTLNTEPGSYYTYDWSPPSFFNNNNSAQVSALISQSVKIHLRVVSQWGCEVDDSLMIGTETCCKVRFPDAFAPQGSGMNAKFRVIPQGQNTIETFMIADRWGKILYNASDNNGWDGTYLGVPQDPGMYAYYVKYTCEGGKAEEAKGTFLLIR